MVTFLITSVFLLGLFAVALYFWQRPANKATAIELPPPPAPRGLFDYDQPLSQLANASVGSAEGRRKALLERASQGDKSALQEAHEPGVGLVYDEVLNILVAKADSAAQLLSLVSHLTRQELPVRKRLAAALIESWHQAPDRNSTVKMLHVAALADDPKVYQTAVEAAMQCWRTGGLPDISGTELQAILEGEFWILSAPARTSGAGFVLKRSLADARRDLHRRRRDRHAIAAESVSQSDESAGAKRGEGTVKIARAKYKIRLALVRAALRSRPLFFYQTPPYRVHTRAKE